MVFKRDELGYNLNMDWVKIKITDIEWIQFLPYSLISNTGVIFYSINLYWLVDQHLSQH